MSEKPLSELCCSTLVQSFVPLPSSAVAVVILITSLSLMLMILTAVLTLIKRESSAAAVTWLTVKRWQRETGR
jgi:VIT1/CCC1 family predicted Fe2+/Mn2+ transporter